MWIYSTLCVQSSRCRVFVVLNFSKSFKTALKYIKNYREDGTSMEAAIIGKKISKCPHIFTSRAKKIKIKSSINL